MFIKEKSIVLFNKSQFCAFEMENNEISLFIQAVKNYSLQKWYLVFSIKASCSSHHHIRYTRLKHCLGTPSSKSSSCKRIFRDRAGEILFSFIPCHQWDCSAQINHCTQRCLCLMIECGKQELPQDPWKSHPGKGQTSQTGDICVCYLNENSSIGGMIYVSI